MQLRAAPELIWRTAIVPHTLGEGPHQVAVNPATIVVAAAISATHRTCRRASRLHHAFGGDRKATPIQRMPVPAQPGPCRHAWLLQRLGRVRAGIARRTGPADAGPCDMALADDRQSLKGDDVSRAKSRAFENLDQRAPTRKRRCCRLAAIGNSWLFDQWQQDYGDVKPNLMSSLLGLGYKISGEWRFQICGPRPAVKPNGKRGLPKRSNRLPRPDNPSVKAILLGGGGVDVVKPGAKVDKPLDRC